MNNPIKLLISGANMGGLITSCALRHDFHKSPRQEDRFQIYRIEKDTLTVEDVDACDLSGIRYAVNATLHDNEASFAFDEKCKEQGIPVIHTVNLGKAAFLAVEKPKGYPFSEVVKKVRMISVAHWASISRSTVCSGRYLCLGWMKPSGIILRSLSHNWASGHILPPAIVPTFSRTLRKARR